MVATTPASRKAKGRRFPSGLTSPRAISRHRDCSASVGMSPHPDLPRRSPILVEHPRPSHPSSNLGQCMRDNVTEEVI